MTITCTPKRDLTIPVYPEVKISLDNNCICSDSYIPVHDELGIPYLMQCGVTANLDSMYFTKAIEEITKEMNIMAMDWMKKTISKDTAKNCIPA